MYKKILLIFLLIFLFFHPSSAGELLEKTVYIAVTSDEHGNLFDYDFISKEEFPGGLVRVSTWIKEFRKEHPDLIVLSVGDIIQGTPVTALHNAQFDKEPDPMIIAMNFIGYQAAALGNHDIEQGLPVLDELQKQAKFPILAANAVFEKKKNKPYFEPYIIIHVDGIKIAVLGMITPGIPQWLNKEVYAGIKFLDIPENAQYWVKQIKKKEKPDIIIGLLHSGYGKKEVGEENQPKPIENAAIETAELNPELDIILSGHIHIPMENDMINGVLMSQPGSGAKNISLITIKMIKTDKNWEVKTKTIFPDRVEMTDFRDMS